MVNSSFRCNKGIDCTENIYSFNLGIKAYPDKDSSEVGDTLWLEVNEPTTLKDFRSGNDIDYSGAENLGSVISFHELSTDRQLTIPAIAKFNYNLQKGVERNVLDPSFEKQYLFIEEGKFYKFKLGLIAREKGIFFDCEQCS